MDRNQLNTYKRAHTPSPTGGALGNTIKTASDASCGTSRQGQGICLLCFPLANSPLEALTISTSISTYGQKRRLLSRQRQPSGKWERETSEVRSCDTNRTHSCPWPQKSHGKMRHGITNMETGQLLCRRTTLQAGGSQMRKCTAGTSHTYSAWPIGNWL